MTRFLPRGGRALALATATALLAGACGARPPTNPVPATGADTVVAEGKGVSLNEYGGARLELGGQRRGGSLRVGVIAPIDTLDPTTALPTSALAVANAIYDPLMRVTPEGEVVPNMAESLTSEDNVHWTLELRPGVTFTDGTPYDAAAVIAHLERYTSPQSQARDAGQARQITAMRAADARTVVFTTASESVEFPFLLAGGAGRVPSPTAVEERGKGFGLKPVGAGPFRLKSFLPGGDLVLVRNPDYRDKNLPYLDRLEISTATDTQSRLVALQAGSLDLASTQSVTDFENAEQAGLTVLQQPAYTYFYLMLNLSKPPFDDPDLRRAMIEAIDTSALSTAVFRGEQTPMKGWFPGSHPEFTPTDYPSYDPDHARELVEKYKAKGGRTDFTLTISSPPEFQRQASIVQQMLADAGIGMSIRVSDQPTMITEAASGHYDAQLRFIGMTLQATTDLSVRFLSTSPGNVTRSGDPALDETIEQLNVTPVDRRHELYAKAQKQLTAWMPSVPLVQQVGGWIVGDRVGGFPGAKGEETVDQFDAKYLYAK